MSTLSSHQRRPPCLPRFRQPLRLPFFHSSTLPFLSCLSCPSCKSWFRRSCGCGRGNPVPTNQKSFPRPPRSPCLPRFRQPLRLPPFHPSTLPFFHSSILPPFHFSTLPFFHSYPVFPDNPGSDKTYHNQSNSCNIPSLTINTLGS